MLGLEFGVSTFAVVVTVCGFMLGLAGGSFLMAARAARLRRPLTLLALLEAGIAVFALLLPWGVRLATPFIDAAAGALSSRQWHGLLALSGLLLLTAPAAAMGAGFPLLLEGFRRRGRSVGAAYGSNTLGASAGALLPLALLPGVGWTHAVQAVAVMSLLAAAGFCVLELQGQRRGGRPLRAAQLPYGTNPPGAADPSGVPIPASAAQATRERRQSSLWPLLNYGIIGAASLLLEMAWLRLFSLVMLRTEYVLALILAVMLLGMGLGSLLESRLRGLRLTSILPWCAAGGAIAGLWLLPAVSGWIERTTFNSLAAAMTVQGLLLAAMTLPVTLSLGAWLPALSRRFGLDGSSLYGANSLGGALGALLYVEAVTRIGSFGAVSVAALAFAIAGLAAARSRRAWFGLPLVFAAAWSASAVPPVRDWLPQAMAGSRDLYRYEDAIAVTQVIEQADGQRVLLTDLRRQDASTEPTAVFVQSNQARLPLLLHADPHSVLFLGLGTGISLAGSLPFPELDRSAVELSAGSIEAAARWFTASNQGVLRETRIAQDDARHFLSAVPHRYDVIVGDVFHPDLAGVGSLLSVEQFARVRSRLAARGLYVQWLALNQFDPDTLTIVLRSFRQVFPDAQLFLDGMHLALVGPRDHWPGTPALLSHLDRLTLRQRAEVTAGEGDYAWLGRYWGPIGVSPGPAQHEWAPVVEFLLPRLQFGGADPGVLLRWLLTQRPTLARASQLLDVAPAQQEEFGRAYAGTELLARSEVAGWQDSALEADRLLGLAYEADPHDRWIDYAVSERLLASIDAAPGRGISRQAFLQKILRINPWSADAWRALWILQRAHGDADAAASRAHVLELSPLDRAAAAQN
jgi:spermidine synthase